MYSPVVQRPRRLVHTQETIVQLRPGLLLSEIRNQTQTYMKDDKRFLRRLKRDIKRVGNRQRRRYLKDVDADPREFDFGRNRTDVMNEPRVTRDSPVRRDDDLE